MYRIKNRLNRSLKFQGTDIPAFSQIDFDKVYDKLRLNKLVNSRLISYKILDELRTYENVTLEDVVADKSNKFIENIDLDSKNKYHKKTKCTESIKSTEDVELKISTEGENK